MSFNFKKSKDGDTPKEPAPDAEKAKGKLSFGRRGAAAREEMDRAQRRQKERRERAGSMRRFFLKPGEERRITFLDGGFDEDGMLDVPYFYEHTVPYEARFENVFCTAKNESPTDGRTEACPLCEQNDEPAYVGYFTIIEHLEEPWEDSDGNKHEYNRRIFPAKLQTLNKLQKKATKLAEREGFDGLVGVTFDVSRSGDRVARVGDDFDFVGHHTFEELGEELEKPEHAKPSAYEDEPELKWRTAEEIHEMGLGGKKKRSFGDKRKPANDEAAKHL